jgi:hypothetical protein
MVGFVSVTTKHPMKTPNAPEASKTNTRLAPRATTLLLALGIHLGFTANATAAPGDLDVSFGNGGVVTAKIDTTPGFYDERIYDIVTQPDGKIVAVGNA